MFGQELLDDWRQFDFKVFALERRTIDGLFYDVGGVATPLEFKKKRRSDTYEYKGPELMVFFRMGVDTEGEPIRIPVGSVTVPSGVSEPLFFFIPTKDSTEERPVYRISWIDDSLSAFPYGEVMVFNASGVELAAKIGEDQLMMAYGPSKKWPVQELVRSSRDPWVSLFFAAEVRPDEYELVYRNTVQFAENSRTIVILRPPRRPRSIKIETYLLEDYIPEILTLEGETSAGGV